MDWYSSVFELIDMRSFSNLWFWIALAVIWSTASHWVIGVPWDMVMRARKTKTAQAQIDLETLVRINSNRILYIVGQSGLLIAGFSFFVITVLLLLGFVYDREFAQAVFLLGFPMGVVSLLSVSTARKIRVHALEGDVLIKYMIRHRLFVQLIGILAIFATALWGMLQNMSSSALGG